MYSSPYIILALLSCASCQSSNSGVKDGESCLTSNSTLGECIPYYLCNEEDIIQESSEGILDIRFQDSTSTTTTTTTCASFLTVCCELGSFNQTSTNNSNGVINKVSGKCILPQYPKRGRYTAMDIKDASPGHIHNYFQIIITCDEGYGVVGDPSVVCLNGRWLSRIPECVRFCELKTHESVKYYCQVSGKIEGRRLCEENEPEETIVLPECEGPRFYSETKLRNMICTEGSWNYVATCKQVPENNTCVTRNKKNGQCLPYYLCDSTPDTIINIYNDSIPFNYETNCSDILDVCCEMDKIIVSLDGVRKIFDTHSTPRPIVDDEKVTQCVDGSNELCNKTTSNNNQITSNVNGECVLPPYPEHGSYVAVNILDPSPGKKYNYFQINITCDKGYGVIGSPTVICFNGFWTQTTTECVRFCRLDRHPSVDYYCLVTGKIEGRRICDDYETSETIVVPECKKPNYYTPYHLRNMICIDGVWNYIATCEAECGRVTPKGTQYVINGRTAERGELPWHAGIYSKQYSPYMQICGGSLVSNTIVVSAAHCFWSDQDTSLPASLFAVAVGKLYRRWNDTRDHDAQKSDVKDIKIPTRFRGNRVNFQDDLALVILKNFIEYQTHIRPVCVDFDYYFEQRHLRHGNMGKTAGWGLTAALEGSAARVLQLIDLPFVDVVECQDQIPADFFEYITSDKFCAGYGNGTALCKGDSGGGLVFPFRERNGVIRYYLRGVVSTAPKNEYACNAFSLTTFTEIQKHEQFYRQYAIL